MAGRIAYYGNIVTDGLVLDLDAGKRDSYPGSGTTWTDISGNGRNGTLTNGPTINSANAGSIVFDGVDDNIAFSGNTFNYSPGISGSISLEIWVYPTGPFTSYIAQPPTTNLGGFLGQGYYGNDIGWGLGMFSSSAYTPNTQFQFQVRNFGTVVGIAGGFQLNNWYHVMGTFTRNDFARLYINGSLISSGSSTSLNGLTITPNIGNASIGRINTFYSGCRIPIARIYNRTLSATEITQNYNALKGRYGL